MSTTPKTGNNSTAEDAVWAALTTHPTSTAADLATIAAVNPSTTRKILKIWADDGTVTRVSDPTNPAAADRWMIAEPANPEPAAPAASAAAPVPAPAPAPAPAPTAPVPPAVAVPAASVTGVGMDPNEVCPTCGRSGSTASPAGHLRSLVETYLRKHPDKEFTPGEIAKALGKSSGAVYNACFVLVGKFVAEYTCEHPHKFRLHPTKAAEQQPQQQ
ncbi:MULTISPECIES: hypothetical protein [unclassified Nocardia]|uniref:hypothetical protein n=1 Tax=unclassified Nocardia TaxID=2637762 RepID=UPI00272EA194|nr:MULTISPECIES: hypothetical protein [unclassified Nocardia]